MQYKFLSNLILVLFLNFLIKPIWIFGIDRTVQNILPANEYGMYFALFNFSMLFNILLDIGLSNYNNKSIAQHEQLLSKYFSGIFLFKLLLALIYFLTTFIVGYAMGYDSLRFKILLFLCINQFLISLIQYFRSNLAGLQLFRLDSLFSVLDKVLMIIFCALLLWSGWLSAKFTIMHFLYVQTLAYAVVSVVLFVVVYSKTINFQLKLNSAFLLVIIKQSFPYAILVITMMFYYRLDAIMLDKILDDGKHQAAIYAQSYRLMDAFIQIPIMFSALLLPMFAKKIANKESSLPLLKLSFEFIFLFAVGVSFFVALNANSIIQLLYQNDIVVASSVLQTLIFGLISVAITNILGTYLTANGSLKALNYISIAGVLFNFILNLIFIPKFEALGAAACSVATHFLVVLCQFVVVIKVIDLKISFKYIINWVAFIVSALGIIITTKQYFNELLIQLVIVMSVLMLLSVWFKLLNIKELYAILKERKD